VQSDRLTRESEVVAADASDVRQRSESLIDDVVQMAVDAANGPPTFCLLTYDSLLLEPGVSVSPPSALFPFFPSLFCSPSLPKNPARVSFLLIYFGTSCVNLIPDYLALTLLFQRLLHRLAMLTLHSSSIAPSLFHFRLKTYLFTNPSHRRRLSSGPPTICLLTYYNLLTPSVL